MCRLSALYLSLWFATVVAAQTELPYIPAPADNPLKGLVPYAKPTPDRFPHSMEFNYLPLSELVVGENQYDWQPLEKLLDDIASRGNHSVFRIWMEYPGRKEGIPSYLEKAGMKVTEWLNTNTDPFPREQVRTPDYADPRLRKMLKSFIAAFGAKYDGDPRIGFITAGLLGTWGEWHTYPREKLMASKQVQSEVMEAYEAAFKTTQILLRYPAGKDAWAHAANHERSFGYHDDSFAWATLDTGRQEDDWFFVPAMKAAGPRALDKWKTHAIGGEIRPELWGQIFDQRPKHPQAQSFEQCVRETHASWLMDTGMFQEKASAERRENAIAQVQRMGYEFHIQSIQSEALPAGGTKLRLVVKNSGVAPFYYDWPVELAWMDGDKLASKPSLRKLPIRWSIAQLLPGQSRDWVVEIPATDKERMKGSSLMLRVVNPLAGGHPLRFANAYPPNSSGDWWPVPRE